MSSCAFGFGPAWWEGCHRLETALPSQSSASETAAHILRHHFSCDFRRLQLPARAARDILLAPIPAISPLHFCFGRSAGITDGMLQQTCSLLRERVLLMCNLLRNGQGGSSLGESGGSMRSCSLLLERQLTTLHRWWGCMFVWCRDFRADCSTRPDNDASPPCSRLCPCPFPSFSLAAVIVYQGFLRTLANGSSCDRDHVLDSMMSTVPRVTAPRALPVPLYGWDTDDWHGDTPATEAHLLGFSPSDCCDAKYGEEMQSVRVRNATRNRSTKKEDRKHIGSQDVLQWVRFFALQLTLMCTPRRLEGTGSLPLSSIGLFHL